MCQRIFSPSSSLVTLERPEPNSEDYLTKLEFKYTWRASILVELATTIPNGSIVQTHSVFVGSSCLHQCSFGSVLSPWLGFLRLLQYCSRPPRVHSGKENPSPSGILNLSGMFRNSHLIHQERQAYFLRLFHTSSSRSREGAQSQLSLICLAHSSSSCDITTPSCGPAPPRLSAPQVRLPGL